ncbi:MAG TPA: FCD domain-containing protein [Streptosporangiaceae bacterium]|nr:FCD domain-containing protein [Streptosporangiaceae bacterium]
MGQAAGASAPIPAELRYRLAELILAESAQAGLGPGSRLPTERKLAADMGATRTSIRHALAVLQAEGHISREVGRGTFLRHAPGKRVTGGADLTPVADGASPASGTGLASPAGLTGLASGAGLAGLASGTGLASGARLASGGGFARGPDLASGAGVAHGAGLAAADASEAAPSFAPADVMTIRRLLEPLAMPLVVAWATAADFKEMDRCLAGGDRASGYDEFENWDLALHRSIMAASHSPLLGQLYSVIETARHGHSWGDLKRRSASRERREKYQADHTALVAALRARDTDRATEAMRAHLARVNSDLFGETA